MHRSSRQTNHYNAVHELYLYWRPWNKCRRFTVNETDCDQPWAPGWVIGPSFDYFEVIAYVESAATTPCETLAEPNQWQLRQIHEPWLKSKNPNLPSPGSNFAAWLALFQGWHAEGVFDLTKPKMPATWTQHAMQICCHEEQSVERPYPYSWRHIEDTLGDRVSNTPMNRDLVFTSPTPSDQELYVEEDWVLSNEVIKHALPH